MDKEQLTKKYQEAARRSEAKDMKDLASKGADVRAVDSKTGLTPIESLGFDNKSEKEDATDADRKDAFRQAIKDGGDVDRRIDIPNTNQDTTLRKILNESYGERKVLADIINEEESLKQMEDLKGGSGKAKKVKI